MAAPTAPASEVPPPGSPASGALNQVVGLTVRSIEFRGAAPEEIDHLRSLLEQKVGEPLDKQKLRRSLEALNATGRFSDLQVEADRIPPNEVGLVFVGQENLFLGRMLVLGAPKKGPNAHQLLNSCKLLLGQLFTETRDRDGKTMMQRAVESMQRALQANGFYQATITPEYIRHPDTQQIEIHFHVNAGEQAKVGKVVLLGSSGMTAEQFMELAKMHPGNDASAERLDRALQRMRKRFLKQDRLGTQVSAADRVYHPESNTVDYAFTVQPGPAVDIRVEGASLSKGLLKKYVPVYEENAVDDDLLNEGGRNLRDYFQTRGYFDAKVNYTSRTADCTQKRESDHCLIIYDVDRGVRHKLLAVEIDWTNTVTLPNHEPYFKAGLIRERMSVQPAGRVLSFGLYSQTLLSHDQQSIVNLYKSNGFQEVKVDTEVRDDYQGVPGRMMVAVHISEGPQTRVNSLTIKGNESVSSEQIRGLLSTLEGQPWSEFNLATDREAVMNYYFNSGFPEVAFDASSTPVPGDPTRMDVTFRITEGKRVYVDRVLVSGLNVTRPYVVDREITFHPGDPLDQSAMFASQRNLYDLGIFNEVDVAVQNPEGQDTEKNMLFDLKEARRWTFNYGFGFEVQTGSEPNSNLPQGRTGVSPRVSFDLTRVNFLGRDHTLLFTSHVGRLEQRGLFTYEAPRWFDHPNLIFSVISFYDNTNDIRTFTSQRLEGAFQLEHRWSRATTLLYRFSYRSVRATNLVIDPTLVPLYSRPTRIGMPSFTFIRDTRDNPLDSHRGDYTAADMGVSTRYFGSQASFARLLLQNSTYHPFGKKRFVLARSIRFGIEYPLASASTPQGVIPLPEELFAGGGNSHRGFSINQAGPRDLDTGFPLGGQALFINNLELRLPPPWLPYLENKVNPVLFYDYGNVFADASDMFHSFLKNGQNNLQLCRPKAPTDPPDFKPTCDFNFMAHAVGGGIRYNTPIGPVRLDFGYNLNPPTFLIGRENQVQVLRRFNFFFSIGQTF